MLHVKPATRPIERIRGRALQAIRKAHFRANPLCVRCKAAGRVRLGKQLDHTVALVNGGVESLDPWVNRQLLCDECHRIKTAEDQGFEVKPRPRIGVDGWPVKC